MGYLFIWAYYSKTKCIESNGDVCFGDESSGIRNISYSVCIPVFLYASDSELFMAGLSKVFKVGAYNNLK